MEQSILEAISKQMKVKKVGFVPHPVAFSDHMVGSVDNSTAVYVVYLRFRKAFDVISYHMLKARLVRCGVGVSSVPL